MSESLWVDLDTWLVNRVISQMGTGNAALNADPLQIEDVRAVALRDVSDWLGWTLPACAVVGTEKPVDLIGHSTMAQYEHRYPYALLFIVEGTQVDVTRDAKILVERAEAVFSSVDATTLSGFTTGSARTRSHLELENMGQVSTFTKRNSTSVFWGVGAIALSIVAES